MQHHRHPITIPGPLALRLPLLLRSPPLESSRPAWTARSSALLVGRREARALERATTCRTQLTRAGFATNHGRQTGLPQQGEKEKGL